MASNVKQYVSDLGTPPPPIDGIEIVDEKMLYGAVVRTPFFVPPACNKKYNKDYKREDNGESESLDDVESAVRVTLATEDKECILIDAKSIAGHNGIKVNGVDIPVFCGDEVLYKGQAAALVLADSIDAARDAASRASVVLTSMPSIAYSETASIALGNSSSGTSSKARRAALAKQSIASNDNTVSVARITRGSGEEGEKSIDKIFREEGAAGRVKIVTAEKHLDGADSHLCDVYEASGAFCALSVQAAGGDTAAEDSASEGLPMLTVMCPTASTPRLRSALCRVLGVGGEQITVQVTARHDEEVDYQTDITAVMAAVAAKETGHDVQLMLRREEDYQYNQNTVALDIKQTATVLEGKIVALKVLVDADIGAYNPFALEVVQHIAQIFCGKAGRWEQRAQEMARADDDATASEGAKRRANSIWAKHSLAIEASDLYEVPNVFIEVRAVRSNRPPTSLCEKSLDTMAMLGISSLMTALFNAGTTGCRHYMVLGKRRAPLEAVIKSVLDMSDFSRKAVCVPCTRGQNRAMGIFIYGNQEMAGASVVEMSVNDILGTKSITHLWLALERGKDEDSGAVEEEVQLSVEKCAANAATLLHCTMLPSEAENSITLEIIETKKDKSVKAADKTASYMERLDTFVYCLAAAAMDCAINGKSRG